MITNGITKRLDVPGEQEWVEIRMLGWAALDAARKERRRLVLANVRAMGGEVLRELQSVDSVTPEQDPADAYDRAMLLQAAVTGWSYKQPPTPDTIGGLDEQTASWLAGEVVTFSTPPSGDALKNSSGPSIVT